MIQNQLTKQEAQRLLDYRDGMLFWRHAGSGRRVDRVAVSQRRGRNGGVKKYVKLGGVQMPAHYVVWNWHHGLVPHGRRVAAANGDLSDFRIENLIDTEIIITPPSRPQDMSCPCCSQRVPIPSPAIVAANVGLTPQQTKVLEAIWDGKGQVVQTERIFDRMYEDDPEGGPSPNAMYLAFKVALSHVRSKLEGSGIAIENVGYRQGFRLVLGD